MAESFHPPIAERSSGELAVIIFNKPDWHPNAVKAAEEELNNRDINIIQARAIYEEYCEEQDAARKELLDSRKDIPLSLYEKFQMILLFPKELALHWDFAQEGYQRKARERKKFLLIGMILYLILAVIVYLYHDQLKIRL